MIARFPVRQGTRGPRNLFTAMEKDARSQGTGMLDRMPFVLFDGFGGSRSRVRLALIHNISFSCLCHCVISYLEDMLRCCQSYEIFGPLEPLESIIGHSE